MGPVDIDESLVRALLRAHHADLADLPLRPLAQGWDNALYRLGEDLVVRLPRRPEAAPLIRHEQRWLALLAPSLPLDVPVPVRTGAPGEGYPWPWSIVPWIPGERAATAPPSDPVQAAGDLAGFLTALCRPAPPEAPANPVRGIPLAGREPALLAHLDRLGPLVDGEAALGVWVAARGAPRWAGPPLWLHGDLHPANVLTRDGRLVAVVDFGDVCAGDPATDLAAAWMLLPAGAHPSFREAVARAWPSATAGPDEATWLRARGWALALGLAMWAGASPDDVMVSVGRAAVAAALADTP